MDSTDESRLFILARAPSFGIPSSDHAFTSQEEAIVDAEALVSKSGVDREVWSALPYRGLFVGMACVHRVCHAPGSHH